MIEIETVTTFLLIGILLGIASAIAHKAKLIRFHDHIASLQDFRRGQRIDLRDPRERLALMLLVALLITLLSGSMFASIAEDVFHHDSLTRYDIGIGRWLLSGTTEGSSEFFLRITTLGNASTIEAGVIIIGTLLLMRKRWLQMGIMLAVVGGGSLLSWLLKNIFMRPRPDFPNAFYHESSYSFPSGHAMVAVCFYGIVAYLLSQSMTQWKWKFLFVILSMIIALLIGLSRLCLGVHYLTDVLAGWSAGLTWLTVCLMASGVFKYYICNPSDS